MVTLAGNGDMGNAAFHLFHDEREPLESGPVDACDADAVSLSRCRSVVLSSKHRHTHGRVCIALQRIAS
jgi:hypothetical protein